VAFSPDGGRIVTGSEDGTAKIWDTASGRELITLNGYPKSVYSVTFSPDGMKVATGGAANHVLIYPALDWRKTPEELEREKVERWRRMWKEAQEKKKK
jgi:WD40 repeat protein